MRSLRSPGPHALANTELLTGGEGASTVCESTCSVLGVGVEDFDDAVRRAGVVPDAVAVPGWEPLSVCRERVVAAATAILAAYDDSDVVLVGHGTAWTLLAAHLTGTAPDLERWRALAMPDVITI